MNQKILERLNKFDGVEIKYCIEFADAGGGTFIAPYGTPEERDREIELDGEEDCNLVRSFASVYLHYKPEFGTGVEAISDSDCNCDAELIYEAISALMEANK